MKLVRCPSCRTVNRVDRIAVCAGCDLNLEGMVGRERPMPAVLRQAARDERSGWFVLGVLGVLACFSAISMSTMVKSLKNEDFGTAMFCTALSLGLVGALLWIPMKRRLRASNPRDAVGCGSYFLGAAAAAIGAVILVFCTCAAFG